LQTIQRPTTDSTDFGIREIRGKRCAAGLHHWRWQAAAAVALACAAFLIAACDDGGGGGSGGSSVEYFPVGGVSESMRVARPNARLTLDHTVVTWLEAAGGHVNDTGSEDGVDEFVYHFAKPTEITLSLDRFDEAPELVALDARGKEIGRATAGADATVTLRGDVTIRIVHPHAGDAAAAPFGVFLEPSPPGADPNDVATLKASKNCQFCNLAGLSWNACPAGASLAGVDISHADFTMANLACVTFQPNGTTPVLLTGAIFHDASLNQVTLKGVDLTDAQFSGTTFEITVFDGVTATSADFSSTQWANSVFGAATGSGSTAPAANFQGAQFGSGSCLSAQDLRDADFTGASFDSASSVHGNWFAGANLFHVTFDGTKFQYDATLPNCGSPPTCTTVTVPNLCTNCPCTAHVGCLDLAGATACPQNQGAVTLSQQPVCQRPTVQAAAEGVSIQNADLTGVSFSGADLTNSVFASNMLDHTTQFAGTILAGVDFTKEDLGRSVDLSGALLSDVNGIVTANFAGAVLSDVPNSNQGVNLSCVISGQTKTGGCQFPVGSTQFNGANLQYATLTNSGLSQVSLEGALLNDANLVGAKLSFASLKGAKLIGAHLGVAPGMLGAAVLSNAYMINVDLTDADLRTVDLSSAHIYGAATDALFVRTLLDSADFSSAILAGAMFTNATLPAAVFNGAQLVNANFDGATLSNAHFDNAYLQGADFSSAKTVNGMVLNNAAVSTMLTSTKCTLIPPGSWMYMDQDGVPYTYAFGDTKLQTDPTVTCPDGDGGPCNTGDSLCPVMKGPFPPIPPCVPSEQFCYENCLDPPCFKDVPNPNTHLCPSPSNCP
jgi:uncharacterized protein YjbI with pentapeptide repeats